MGRHTAWQRRHRGIIYAIRNRVDGKCYIGQTVSRFIDRYHGGKWWKTTTNPYLRAAAAKHGVEAFDVELLAHSKTLEELNRLEAGYAKTYRAYAPRGYNLVECGENKRQHPDSIAKRSRTIVLNSPSGADVTITNVRQFCRNQRLDERCISRVLAGKHASHKGWTLQGVTTKHHRNNRSYTLYDRAGARHEVIGLSRFCRKRGLVYHGMRSMVQGKIFESQGFALSMAAFAMQRTRHVVTLINDGREVTLNSVKRECGALGLHARYVYQLIAGRIASYKGWTVKRLSSATI